MKTSSKAIIAVIAIGLMAACDNPVDSGDEDHADVLGYVLLMDGDEVARLFDAQITGQVTLSAGETTDEIRVEFLDPDGDRIDPTDFDEEFSLLWEIIDPSVASLEDTGPWSTMIIGERPGTTYLSATLFHVTHEELQTPPPGIPVVVQ